MQATGRMGAGLRSGCSLLERAMDVGLCGRRLEGLRLMRGPLGGVTHIALVPPYPSGGHT